MGSRLVPVHWRSPLSRLAALAACGLVIASAHIFRPLNVDEASNGVLLVFASILVLGLALWLRPTEVSAPAQPAALAVPTSTIRWRPVLFGLIGIALIALVNALPDYVNPLPIIGWLWTLDPQFQFWLLWISLALLVWGLVGKSSAVDKRKRRSFPERLFTFRLGHRALWALLAITLLAFVLRVWNLEYSIHRFIDEILYMDGIIHLWDDPTVKILVPFNQVTAFTWLYPYAQMMSVSLFGTSLTSIRLVSAIVGTLTIPALYLLAVTLFDRKTAVLAALFLATFPPHIHFSRLGLNNIADPLVGTLALALLARGVKHGTWRDFVLAGVCLGFTQYFYEGGRLLYPPLVLLWAGRLYLLVRGRSPGAVRPFLVFALVALTITLPIYTTLAAHGLTLTARMDSMGASSDFWHDLATDGNLFQAWLNHARFPFWFYVQMGDTSWFYGGNWGLVQGFMQPAFFLGIGYAVWHLRKPACLLLLVWIVATALGNGLLRDVAEAPRFIVAFPALALLMAIGIRYTLPLLMPSAALQAGRPAVRRVYQGAVVLGIMTLAAAQINHYFGAQLYAFNHQFRITHDPDDAMFRAIQLPHNTDVHIIGDAILWDLNIQTVLRFWGRSDMTMTAMRPEWLTEEYLRLLAPSRNQAFFVQPEDFATIRLIRKYFILDTPQISPYDLPVQWQFVLYFSPRYPTYLARPRPPLDEIETTPAP